MTHLVPVLRPVLGSPFQRDKLYREAGEIPTLDLFPALTRSWTDLISNQNLVTTVRNTTRTVLGADGTLQTVAIDQPAFVHDAAGNCLGGDIWQQNTQLLELTETLATQTKTVTAVAHTLSFYGTGTVVLSGTASATVVGTGAFPTRTTYTFTPTAGSLTLTVTGTVQYGQLEAGSLASPYIPNTGTGAVTRSADQLSITGADFSQWYNQAEGTLWVQYLAGAGIASRRIASINDGTSGNNILLIASNGSGTAANYLEITSGGSTQAILGAGTVYASGTQKSAATYKANDIAFSRNGGAALTDNTATIPNVTRLEIGSLLAANYLNGPIARLIYWPRRLPNSVIQALAT